MHVSGVSRVYSVASLSAKSCLLRTDYAILSVVGRHAAWSARHPDGGEHEGRWQVTSPFRVTLNYRGDGTSGHAGRLYDALAERFGSEHVFMDIEAIEPGVDFGEAIDRALASADAFICMIGTDWLRATDAQGRRRLDNPGDFVRLEIEAALKREIRVIPVLVRSAEMPQSDELPESLAGLASRPSREGPASRQPIPIVSRRNPFAWGMS
jgi:hypothetical protein